MTPAAHLLSGYLVGEAVAASRPGKTVRFWVVGAALVGSIAPDCDVVLGLVGGWRGASMHRGFTHSLLGSLILASLVAAVARKHRLMIFAAAWGGVLTHIFCDSLNFWGVRALWPSWDSLRVNLAHEGDLYVTAILLVGALLVWRKRRRAAVVWLMAALPAYFAVQIWWRDHARELARVELSGRRAAVYPTDRLRCGWIALSAGDFDLRADCVISPRVAHLQPALTVPVHQNFFTRASERSPAVREFLRQCPFPFAEEHPVEDGGALVIWRDLREAHQQKPADVPTGIHVRLNAGGEIVSEGHRWWLSLW